MIYTITLLTLIIACCLYETFKPYKSMWSHCVVKFDKPKIEKIRFERKWRDRDGT